MVRSIERAPAIGEQPFTATQPASPARARVPFTMSASAGADVLRDEEGEQEGADDFLGAVARVGAAPTPSPTPRAAMARATPRTALRRRAASVDCPTR